MTTPVQGAAACCAEAYGHPLARYVLGPSFHPGGLDLTAELAARMGLDNTHRVLDIGCGTGASAEYLAANIGCAVVGVTLETDERRVNNAGPAALIAHGDARILKDDFHTAPLEPGSFDAAISECVLSTMPDKPAALARARELLKPSGRIGITDVTVSGLLPPSLQTAFAAATCIARALPLQEYANLLRDAGFHVEYTADLRATAALFMKELKGRLLMAEIAAKLGKIPVNPELVADARQIAREAASLVERGIISYGILIARRDDAA